MSKPRSGGRNRRARAALAKLEQESRNVPSSILELTSFTATTFSGPIPPPEMIREYRDIDPKLAELVIDLSKDLTEMAIAQAAHRQGLEQTVISGGVDAQRRGQWMAFVVAVLFAVGGGVLIWNGKEMGGLGVILTDITALATVFIIGKREAKAERQIRMEALMRHLDKSPKK